MPYDWVDHQLRIVVSKKFSGWRHDTLLLYIARLYMEGTLKDVVCLEMGIFMWRKYLGMRQLILFVTESNCQ